MTNLYSNTLTQIPATITTGNHESSIIDLTNSAHGMVNIVALEFDDNWTTSDVNIKSYKSLTDINPRFLYITDTSVINLLILPSCSNSIKLAVQPWWFCSLGYMTIYSSNSQTLTTQITIWCQPIFQGIA